MLTSGDCPTIVTLDKELDILLKQCLYLKLKKPPLLCKNDDKYTTLQLTVQNQLEKRP